MQGYNNAKYYGVGKWDEKIRFWVKNGKGEREKGENCIKKTDKKCLKIASFWF